MIICDLCGEPKDCLQKDIDGKEYDICADCWKPIAERLKGKGRVGKREIVVLPLPRESEPDDGPKPGEPPQIWGAA